jgi:hypothetical protein
LEIRFFTFPFHTAILTRNTLQNSFHGFASVNCIKKCQSDVQVFLNVLNIL